jgi:tetratricopeptide (TPR) repeat protein
MGFFQVIWHLIKAFLNLRKAMRGADRARVLMRDPVMAAFIHGNYEQAKSLGPDPFFQAMIAMQLGGLADAEQRLRSLAASEQRPQLGAVIQSTLGQVLLQQSRYDQAMECFQAALRLWPERGSTYRDIAETWLRRGNNSQEALNWARQAVQKEKSGPGLSEDSKNICLGEDLATLAWAVAAHTHDVTEVERLTEEVSMPAITPVSTQAQVSFHFGKAFGELGNLARSVRYFEHAASVDPNGLWGRAAAALAATSHA